MTTNQIQFGQGVYSQDGEKIGSVDHFVLNTENNHVENIVVKQGVLSGDKLIDIDVIDRVDADRIVLSMPADEAEKLPDFVEKRFTQAPADVSVTQPFLVPSGLGGGRFFYSASTMGRGYADSTSTLFDPAPVDPPTVEDRSNLPMQDVMIGKGTDVVAADGEKVGSVEEVVFDEQGNTAAFIISEGVLFKHRLRVPMAWVENAGEDEIRLNVPSGIVGRDAELKGV